MADANTDVALDSFADCRDPRLRQVMQALVRHAHAFVRDVRLTRGEWEQAIAFLTQTGQICDAERQEFILLSDTLGISTVVEDLNYSATDAATESTVLGPFFVAGAPALSNGTDISGGEPGERLFVEGVVTDAGGQRIADATVEVWQSNARGFYDVQNPDRTDYNLRGRFRTDDAGRFWLWSIRPEKYPIPHDGPVGRMLAASGRHPYRPAHVHFKIVAAGFETIVTQIFDADSHHIADDAVFGVKPSLVQTLPEQVGPAPDGTAVDGPWRLLSRRFVLMPQQDDTSPAT